MKTKMHLTIILVIILILLGIIACWLISTQETAVNKSLVLNLSDSDIFGFEITKTDQNQKTENFAVRKNSENIWIITAPIEDIADPGTISIMLASLKGIMTPTTIKNFLDLAEYGLDRPSLTATIILKRGKKVTLNFGSESPIPDMFYAQLAGRKEIVAIGKDIKNNLSPKLSYLRERKVVNVTSEQLRELVILCDEGQVYRMVNSNGTWELIEPYRKKLSLKSINNIISGLNNLWTHENDDDLNNLIKYGLNQPEYRVEFKLADGKTFSLIANKVNHDYYMLNSLRPTIIRQKNPDAFNFLKDNLRDL